MTKWRRNIIILFFFMVLLISLPTMHTFAQENEADPDFIVTLALMAVADDRLDTVLDTSDLTNLRDMVDGYYAVLPYSQMDEENASAMRQEKKTILASLDSKIDFQKSLANRSLVVFFMAMSRGHDPNVINYERKQGEDINHFQTLLKVLSGKTDPDPAVAALLKAHLEKDSQNTLQKDLDGHIAATAENGDQLVAQNSDTVYDFSAGLSKDAYLAQLSQNKPLRFINNGSRDVNVSIEYYAPPVGVDFYASGFSTQVRGESSVIATGFPQGNYTFCADWQTDMDTDGDGIKDYDRMVTHIWLNSGSPDDPNFAEQVYVNSVATATPIGSCKGFEGEAPSTEELMTEIFMTESDPEGAVVVPTEGDNMGGDQAEEAEPAQDADFWDQGDNTEEDEDPIPTEEQTQPAAEEGGSSLTPAELANQGQHNYQIVCKGEEDVITRNFSATINFTADGVTMDGNFYGRVSPNVYQNDYPATITFTTNGYLKASYYTEGYEGEMNIHPFNCTATIQ